MSGEARRPSQKLERRPSPKLRRIISGRPDEGHDGTYAAAAAGLVGSSIVLDNSSQALGDGTDVQGEVSDIQVAEVEAATGGLLKGSSVQVCAPFGCDCTFAN